jgi:hypothetical protein
MRLYEAAEKAHANRAKNYLELQDTFRPHPGAVIYQG